LRIQTIGSTVLNGQSGAETTVPGGVGALYPTNPLAEIALAKRELNNNAENNRRLDAVPVAFVQEEIPDSGGQTRYVVANIAAATVNLAEAGVDPSLAVGPLADFMLTEFVPIQNTHTYAFLQYCGLTDLTVDEQDIQVRCSHIMHDLVSHFAMPTGASIDSAATHYMGLTHDYQRLDYFRIWEARLEQMFPALASMGDIASASKYYPYMRYNKVRIVLARLAMLHRLSFLTSYFGTMLTTLQDELSLEYLKLNLPKKTEDLQELQSFESMLKMLQIPVLPQHKMGPFTGHVSPSLIDMDQMRAMLKAIMLMAKQIGPSDFRTRAVQILSFAPEPVPFAAEPVLTITDGLHLQPMVNTTGLSEYMGQRLTWGWTVTSPFAYLENSDLNEIDIRYISNIEQVVTIFHSMSLNVDTQNYLRIPSNKSSLMNRFLDDAMTIRNPMVPYPAVPNQNTMGQDILQGVTIIAGYSPKMFRVRVDIQRSGVFEVGITYLREDMTFNSFTPYEMYRAYRMILDESYIGILENGLPAPMLVEAELAKATPYSWLEPAPAAAVNPDQVVAVAGDIAPPATD